MTNLLYNKDRLIDRLHQYFFTYFETYSAPAAQTLFLLVLAILAMESAHSIRFLYRHFLSGITEKPTLPAIASIDTASARINRIRTLLTVWARMILARV